MSEGKSQGNGQGYSFKTSCWLPDIQILPVLSAPVITTSIFCVICLFIAPVIQADGPAKIYPVQAHAQW